MIDHSKGSSSVKKFAFLEGKGKCIARLVSSLIRSKENGKHMKGSRQTIVDNSVRIYKIKSLKFMSEMLL